MNRFVIIFVLGICFISCTNEIEVDQPSYKTQIVVDGWIENGNQAYVILTRSSPFLTHYDSASIRNTFLNSAKITVSNGKGDSEILTLTRKEEFFPPFVYKSIQLKGEIGESYDIKVEVDGRIIESSTTIPQLPEVINVKPVVSTDTTMHIDVKIMDDLSVNRYYYSEIKTKGVDTNFHPSSYPLYSNKGFDNSSQSIRILRSDQPNLLNIYDIDDQRNLPRYEYSLNDTVFVKFASIDVNSFQILNDLFLDRLNSQNPFSFVDKKTSTNITGGIGRWTGLASKNYMVFSAKN